MGVIALQTTYQHDLVTLNGAIRKTNQIGISSTRLFCTVLGLCRVRKALSQESVNVLDAVPGVNVIGTSD